jgi:hypothetical protein
MGKYKPNDPIEDAEPGTVVSAMSCPQCNGEMEYLGKLV